MGLLLDSYFIWGTYSFISSDLVDRLDPNFKLVNKPPRLSNPMGGLTCLCFVCIDVRIIMLDCLFLCDMYVLAFFGFSILLDMNWLGNHEAILECKR